MGGAGVYFNFDAFDVFLESRIKAARAVKCVGGARCTSGQIVMVTARALMLMPATLPAR